MPEGRRTRFLSRVIKAQEIRRNPELVGDGGLETLLATLARSSVPAAPGYEGRADDAGAEGETEVEADPAVLARSIIDNAERAARARLEEAERESARVLHEAYEKGYEDGRAEAVAKAMAHVRDVLEYMDGLARAVAQATEGAVRAAEDTIARLAIEIAEKILRHEVSVAGSVVLGMVRESVQKARTSGPIKIRVSAWDLDRVREFQDEIMRIADDVTSIEVVEDSRVEPGGCIVETDFGSVDARITSQLREIGRAFFGNGDATAS